MGVEEDEIYYSREISYEHPKYVMFRSKIHLCIKIYVSWHKLDICSLSSHLQIIGTTSVVIAISYWE